MRLRTKVWIAIATVCIGLTVYEIPKAMLIWRYVHMAGRDKQELKDRASVESVLTEEVVTADPEAADILTYCLVDPNDEDLADLVGKYPDNEFFLAQLAHRLTEVNLVDTRAALAFTDRLVALAPDNAHYRYMKGWLLLKPPWGAGRERDALEQFELGNGLPQFYLPYSKYKQRVDKLSDRAGISPLKRRRAQPSETGIYRDLVKFISRAYGVYPKLDRESFRRLSAAGAQAAERLINNARHDGHLGHGDMLLASCEGARLRYLDLTPEEAQQALFRLSQSLEIRDVLGDCTIAVWAVLADLMKITLVVAVSTVFLLPPLFPLVWLFVIIVNLLRG